MTGVALFALTAVAIAGTVAALRFRSRNNPKSAAGLAGWYLLGGVGFVILVGGYVGLILEIRAAR